MSSVTALVAVVKSRKPGAYLEKAKPGSLTAWLQKCDGRQPKITFASVLRLPCDPDGHGIGKIQNVEVPA